jgi:ABC-type dipeptide/oligopeptide/nickel transport system permease component
LKFQGKGPTASKFAAWLNKCHNGSLGKYVKPSKGIQVFPTDSIGVTLAATAPAFQMFYLTSLHTGSYATRLARSVTTLTIDHYKSSGFATPLTAPSTSLPEVELYFAFNRGWHPKGTVVVAADIGGRWEVITPGLSNFFAVMATSGSVTIPGSFDFYFGEEAETDVDVDNPFNFTLAADDEVRVAFDDPGQILYVDGKACS